MYAETNLRVHGDCGPFPSHTDIHCISPFHHPLSADTVTIHNRQYFARATGAEKVLKTIYKQLKPFRFY